MSKEVNEVRINIPEGMEIDRENSTFECTKFKPVKREQLPKTWKEFCETHPIREGEYCIDNESDICVEMGMGNPRRGRSDRNLILGKETAEAFLALMQLVQLRDCYNDGWKPDWSSNDVKYIIFTSRGQIVKDEIYTTNSVLSFKTEELRDKFLENFRDLIEIAKPLI